MEINSSIKDCLQSMSEGGREGGGCYINSALVVSRKTRERRGGRMVEKDVKMYVKKKKSTVCTV